MKLFELSQAATLVLAHAEGDKAFCEMTLQDKLVVLKSACAVVEAAISVQAVVELMEKSMQSPQGIIRGNAG
jgi:hypothetical protein